MTINAAIVAVGAFLQPLMPTGTKIVRGQANGVPPPLPPSIVLTEVGQPQYTTTRTSVDGVLEEMTYNMPKMLNVQIDFYGADAGDMCYTAVTMLRSIYGVENFPDGVKPLYCSDALQAPLITGEKEFLKRWLTTLSLQYNASVTVDQESFVNLGEVTIDPVDVTVPVE
jgi:hypothetical protein